MQEIDKKIMMGMVSKTPFKYEEEEEYEKQQDGDETPKHLTQ